MAEKIKRSTQIKAAVTALAAVLMIIVVFQNTEAVHTKVLFGTVSMPRALLLAVTFLVGVLTGAILCRRWTRK